MAPSPNSRYLCNMKLTFLGTGTSQGVPVIGCRCNVCRSADRRDRRLRTSAAVECGGKRIVIDAGPDFRYQMLRAGITSIDALLLTHEHKDHIGGIDDVRAFNFADYPHAIRTVDIYAARHTADVVLKDYDYAFGEARYRGVPEIELHVIDEQQPFTAAGIGIVPVAGCHSDRFRVTGYRIGPLAYLTDFRDIAPAEISKIEGVDTLVVNALRHREHPSHFNIAQALELIERVRPRAAYLTHMSHEAGLHEDLARTLPAGVMPAYDTLEIEIND